MSNNLPTIEQAIDDRDCSLIFWRTSTDVIIAPESPYAYESQGRHIRLDAFALGDSEGVFCPRCYNDWDWAVVHGGLARCKTRECHTAIETTGRSNPSPPMTEEEIVFDEFEDDLHDEIANHIDNNGRANSWSHPSNLPSSFNASRAKDNIDNPPTIGEDMNGAREEFDTGERHDSNEFDTTTSPQDNNNKEEQ